MEASERPLHIPAVVAAVLRVAWHDGVAAGREPCGYLVGTIENEASFVVRAPAGCNVHRAPARAFALAPGEHLQVRRDAHAEGLRVLGCWHGHLRGDARPSRADLDGLGPLGPSLLLILGRETNDPPRLRAWRRVEDAGGGAADAVPIEVPLVLG